MNAQAPVFVKIEEFKELTKILKNIDNKIHQIEQTVAEIKTLKEQEEEQINEWDASVAEIKTKLAEINNELFQQ